MLIRRIQESSNAAHWRVGEPKAALGIGDDFLKRRQDRALRRVALEEDAPTQGPALARRQRKRHYENENETANTF